MNNIYKAAIVIAALAGGTGTAFAASSVDLSVSGSIVPSSCTPTLNNANVSFGRFSASDLDLENPTYHPGGVRHSNLSVNCVAATVYALRAIDNRASSLAPELEAAMFPMGLGMTGANERIGGHYLSVNTAASVVDGQTPFFIIDNRGTWTGGLSGTWAVSNTLLGFRDAGGGAGRGPIPIKDAVYALEHTIAFAPGNGLTLTDDVALDGHSTIEIVYL